MLVLAVVVIAVAAVVTVAAVVVEPEAELVLEAELVAVPGWTKTFDHTECCCCYCCCCCCCCFRDCYRVCSLPCSHGSACWVQIHRYRSSESWHRDSSPYLPACHSYHPSDPSDSLTLLLQHLLLQAVSTEIAVASSVAAVVFAAVVVAVVVRVVVAAVEVSGAGWHRFVVASTVVGCYFLTSCVVTSVAVVVDAVAALAAAFSVVVAAVAVASYWTELLVVLEEDHPNRPSLHHSSHICQH